MLGVMPVINALQPTGSLVTTTAVPSGTSVLPAHAGPSLTALLPYDEKAAAANDASVTLALIKPSKGRCGVGLQQTKTGLVVSAVSAGSTAAKAGLLVGDVLVSIDGTSVERQSAANKHKAMGLLFDAKGTCIIQVRGLPRPSVNAISVTVRKDSPKASAKASPKAVAAPPVVESTVAAATVTTTSVEAAVASAAASAASGSSMAKADSVVDVQAANAEDTAISQEEQAAVERRKALKAKIADRYASAKAAAGTTDAFRSKLPAKVFARGEPVLYDNPKNGKLEFAHVVRVHTHEDVVEYYSIQTNMGEDRHVEADRLSKSAWSAPLELPPLPTSEGGSSSDGDSASVANAVIHVHPYAPPGPRIGVGHHNWGGKLNHHGPGQILVPNLDLTVRGIGGNGKKAASMGYAAWKKSLLGK